MWRGERRRRGRRTEARRRAPAPLPALHLAAVAAAACGGSDGTGPDLPVLSGDYTLTLAVDAAGCPTWPDAVRVRTYDAILAEATDGSGSVAVSLAGADFLTHQTLGELSSFGGVASGDSVRFTLQRGDYGIVERIGPVDLLEVLGQVDAALDGSTISGFVRGGWGFGTDLRNNAGHVSCASTVHPFTLAPR